MVNRFSDNVADRLDGFYQDETWRLIKKRLEIYISALEYTALSANRRFDRDRASYYALVSEGVKGAIQVTEGLSSEIKSGSFDVDDALHVIENKIEYETEKKERKRSWLMKLLGKKDNHKPQKQQ